MAGFPQATPADMGPVILHGNVTPNDPAEVLSGEPLRKVIALHQRSLDLHATVPPFSDVQELQTIRMQHQNRIAELLRPRSENGFGESEAAGVVIHERKKLARASDELKRVQMLKEIRSGRWNAAARLDQAVRDWLLQGGIPSGCRIESVEDAPLSELLTKADNGRIDAALDRCRLKLRERAADLHRVRSAPWPVAVAKAAVKSQIDAIADAAAPDIDRAVEHDPPVIFATTHLAALVRNLDAPGAATISEVPDAFGTLVWLCRDRYRQRFSPPSTKPPTTATHSVSNSGRKPKRPSLPTCLRLSALSVPRSGTPKAMARCSISDRTRHRRRSWASG